MDGLSWKSLTGEVFRDLVLSAETAERDLAVLIGGGGEWMSHPFSLDEALEPAENRLGTILGVQ